MGRVFDNEGKRNTVSIAYLYFKHLIRAKTSHGIHSPFVFSLLKNCIYLKTNFKNFEDIEKQRKKLRVDKGFLEISDFGSYKKGEKGFVKRRQQIKMVARKSLKSPRQAAILYRLASYFECDNILELGACFGLTTAYLSRAHPQSIINTIEGCCRVAEIANNVFETLKLKNVKLYVGEVDELLIPVLQDMKSPPGLVFMDANHTQQATLKYFNTLTKYLDENSIIIIDDIHWSAGMEKAWNEICGHDAVSVTVDLFHMGLVFFRKGLSKENFLIRF